MVDAVATIDLRDEQDTVRLGAIVAKHIEPSSIVYLQGDLGAGKTTFSRGLIHALGFSGVVKSPTYTLVELYESATTNVAHFDLYRLATVDELDYLGVDELSAAGYVFLVEWPEVLGDDVWQPSLRINLNYSGAGRSAKLQGQLAHIIERDYQNE